jgi:hypothetical protein
MPDVVSRLALAGLAQLRFLAPELQDQLAQLERAHTMWAERKNPVLADLLFISAVGVAEELKRLRGTGPGAKTEKKPNAKTQPGAHLADAAEKQTPKGYIDDVLAAAERSVASWPEWMRRPENRVRPPAGNSPLTDAQYTDRVISGLSRDFVRTVGLSPGRYTPEALFEVLLVQEREGRDALSQLIDSGRIVVKRGWRLWPGEAATSPWNGLCAAGRHGLDYEGQACDLCAKPPRARPAPRGSKKRRSR